MPSLALPDHPFSEAAKDKKEKKNKKMKNMETVNGDLETDSPISEKKKKKESKKRKALEIEEEEERSETSSELVEPVNSKAEDSEKEKKKRKKTAKVEEEEEEEEGKSEEDPNAISRFRISEPLRAKLKEKGITSLFPIQAMTFDTVLDGSDLVGRARTGQVYVSSPNVVSMRVSIAIYMDLYISTDYIGSGLISCSIIFLF